MNAVASATLAVVLLVTVEGWAADIPNVDVVETRHVTCPSPDAIRSALLRLRGRPNGSAELSYQLLVDRTAEQIQLELRSGSGHTVLVREIQVGATDCAHAAEAVALIVERHFRAVEWLPSGAEPVAVASRSPAPFLPPVSTAPPPSVPATSAAASPSATPSTVAATATATISPPDQPPLIRFDPALLPRLAFGVGPALWSRGTTFAVALDGRWRVLADSPFEIGLGVLLPPLHGSGAVGSGGTVHVSAVPLTASLGLAGALGSLAVGGHAGGLWTIEHGTSQAIPDPATAWRTIFGLGLGISAAWPLSARLHFTGSLDGYRTILGRSFAVAGVPGAVLDPAPWQGIAVLGVEWVVSP